MGKADLINYFYQTNQSMGGRKILLSLIFGLCIAVVIFFTYKFTYSGVAYNAKFNVSNVIILLITVVIMIMISSNIIISLGMVGALSIVRFRTAIKDPRDTVFIFWSIAEGLSVGSQNFKLALISTLFIAVLLVAAGFYSRISVKYLIIVKGTGEAEIDAITALLKSYNKLTKLRAANNSETSTELIYEALVKNEFKMQAVDELKKRADVTAVNILLESGDNVG